MVIAIIPNAERDNEYLISKKITEFFISHGIKVVSDCENIDSRIVVMNIDKICAEADIIISLGGDGTILRLVHQLNDVQTPIFGVNLGNVGYMNEIEADELDKLSLLISGEYFIEKRMMLSCEVYKNRQRVFCEKALNDAVVSHGALSRMVSIDLFVNGEHISSVRGDGMIFSTPTGSTAYSFSAGGPIVEPTLESLIMTPVCVHSFNKSPIIFSPKTELGVKFDNDRNDHIYVTVDGFINYKLESNDYLKIKRSDTAVNLIRFKNKSFYSKLSEKLK